MQIYPEIKLPNLTASSVVREVSDKYGLKPYHLKSSRRAHEITVARAEVAKRLQPTHNNSEIARMLNKHPSTIHFYLNNFTE